MALVLTGFSANTEAGGLGSATFRGFAGLVLDGVLFTPPTGELLVTFEVEPDWSVNLFFAMRTRSLIAWLVLEPQSAAAKDQSVCS